MRCYVNDVFPGSSFQSFHLQPTSTPGTYYLQTTPTQGLPLSLSNNSTVSLTTGSSPSPHEHIILHSLSVSLCLVFSSASVHVRRLISLTAPPTPPTLCRRTDSALTTESSSRPSPPTPPLQKLSANRSWSWPPRGRARMTSWKPQVSWRAQRASSRKPKSQ